MQKNQSTLSTAFTYKFTGFLTKVTEFFVTSARKTTILAFQCSPGNHSRQGGLNYLYCFAALNIGVGLTQIPGFRCHCVRLVGTSHLRWE